MVRQTDDMPELRPAANADPARWLLRAEVEWWDLVRYGPPGFDVYLRVAFRDEADGVEPGGEDPALRHVLTILAKHTATPTTAYAAIWEGWTSRVPAPEAPRVEVPNRAMLLFTGHVGVMRDAPALRRRRSCSGQSNARRCAAGALRGAGTDVPRSDLAPPTSAHRLELHLHRGSSGCFSKE